MTAKLNNARRLQAALAAVAIVLLVGASITADTQPAEAYTVSSKSKKAGKVKPTGKVEGAHWQFCIPFPLPGGGTYQNCMWSPMIVTPRTKIWRTKKSKATQKVVVNWQVQRLNGNSWYTHTQGVQNYTIKKGKKAVTTQQWSVIPTAAYDMRVVLKVKWTNTKGKKLAGYKAVMNQKKDYRCATQFPCQVKSKNIWLKSPGI